MRAPKGRGNPLSYYNGKRYTFTWEEGRNLVSAVQGTNTYTYAYDSNGLRTSKTVNGVKHDYLYASGRLLRETYGDVILDFVYDHNGHPFALRYTVGGTTTNYYYITNLQGDVLTMITGQGVVVASYSYDPYGKVLSATGEMANINPLRYRGYYYDMETGFYYLQSRYYDPELCRFINADGYISTGYGNVGHNMFAYCGNDPINYVDSSGKAFDWIFDYLKEIVAGLIEQCIDLVNEIAKLPFCSNDYLTIEQMQHNAELIYNYLSNAGWGHNAICAVLGNMQQESNINPGMHQKGDGTGFGLVQWTPPTKYTDWADNNGYSHTDLYAQLDYLIYSMQPACSEWLKDNKNPDYYVSASYFIKSEYSVEYLTLVFFYSYERAGDSTGTLRVKYANYWDEYFGGWIR